MFERLTSIPFSHILRHKSTQNFIFLLIIQASNILISLMAMPLLIQAIGVDRFGLVSLALSVILIANVFVGFGFNLSGPREIALNQKNKKALSQVLSQIISSKLVLALIASMALLLSVFGFGLFPEYRAILTFSILMLFSEATLPVWFFQGMERMRLVSVANVFSKLLYLMGIVLFINGPEDAKLVNFFFGGAAFTINLLLLTYVHYELGVKFYLPQFSKITKTWKSNVYLFLSNLANHISVNGGIVILSFFAPASMLGMYSLAERVSLMLRMLPSMMIGAIYPNASKLYQNDLERFYGFLVKVYRGAVFLALFVGLLTNLLAPFIIKVLSKSDMAASVVFLRILAFVPLFATMNIANMIMILVANQKKILFKSSWTFCIYMVIVAVSLTSWLGGKGLAIAMLSTELVIFITCSLLLRQTKPVLFKTFYAKAFGRDYHS
ncbi:oligosaccharide flippase family protein [Echinicola jeungdonensis]|uniref:Oligosaccharide flippase family protein n=1 Tax=Echinicola jeungdonensis TaxID=709343 RepID=A0ABV5J6L6_9BACT|nr:oligosaccharide flippase family protein [Echinicola jeungdonensis]MDN3669268.1 oligosaccharide flippase family protein [Echinicola jeungdonensis]